MLFLCYLAFFKKIQIDWRHIKFICYKWTLFCTLILLINLLTSVIGLFFPPLVFIGVQFVCLLLLALFTSQITLPVFKNFILLQTAFVLLGLVSFFYQNHLFANTLGYSIRHPHQITYFLGSQGFIGLGAPQSIVIYIDSSNILFLLLTAGIGLFCTAYSYFYMNNEVFLKKFVLLLQLFLISMLFLLSAKTLVSFLLGWELIGVFSFLLINFWSNKIATFKSAFKAFLFNKLSDVSLIVILVISILYSCPDTIFSNNFFVYILNFSINVLGHTIPLIYVYMFFLTICCFCKSAQFGFHIWLPDSMEAPIPASALIHSATLVSAGLYLMHKTPFLLFVDNYAMFLLLWGGFTSLYGSFVALYQTDVKKILAYSTISHCGLLFCLLALNQLDFFYLYLYSHGIFKSLSFMVLGNIISYSRNYQDSRRIGSFVYNKSFYYLILVFSVINLAGLPFSIGFYSKHFMLLLVAGNSLAKISFLFIYLSCLNGLFYSYNLLYNLFFSFFKQNSTNTINFPYRGRTKSHPNQFILISGLLLVVLGMILFLLKYIELVSICVKSWADVLALTSSNFFFFFNFIYIVVIFSVFLTSKDTYFIISIFFGKMILYVFFLV